MNFSRLLYLLFASFLVNNKVQGDCNSCNPSSLKLVSRNNTPAPVIMGNFHENGCVVTVVACDIPECSDAVLDSYRPDGSFKRVTNDEGTVWPHLETTCSPDGNYMWDGEVQTEFSCYADGCDIPTSTSPSLNGTESTVSSYSESTDYTVSLALTTTDRCNGQCTDIEKVLLNDNVKLARPVLKIMSREGCGTYLVDCRPEIDQICDNIVLYNGLEIVSQSQVCAQLPVDCTGNGFVNEGFRVVNNMFCKFINCRDNVTTTYVSDETTTFSSTVADFTITTSVNDTESTVSAYSESTDYTVSIAATTTDRCNGQCTDIEKVLLNDNVKLTRPVLKILSRDGCGTYLVDCRPEQGQICDNIVLYNGLEIVSQSQVCAQLPVDCTGNGFVNEGFGVVNNMFCKFINCRDNVTTTYVSDETSTFSSTVSDFTFTTTVNDTESTVSAYSESTDYTVSLALTTTDRCNGQCTDIEKALLNDNVKLTRPVLKIMSREGCGTYLVDCRPEIGQICENIVLYNGLEIVSQSQVCAQLPVDCTGNGFVNEGFGVVNNMFCKFTNCRDNVTSISIPDLTTSASF